MTEVVQNKWMRDLIPAEFCDVDYLIEETMFEALIFFWEQDNGKESLEHNSLPWDESGPFGWNPERKVCYDAMLDAYTWAITRSVSEPKPPSVGRDWVRGIKTQEYSDAAAVYRVEQEKWDAEKDKHLFNILKYRKYLWS